MAPRYTDEITIRVPFTTDIFVDCLDAEGNYVTQFISKELTVNLPKEINSDEFYDKVMGYVEGLFYNIVTPFEDVNKFYEISDQTL
jgi:hypothetical protein